MRVYRTFDELHLEMLKDPEDAKVYLQVAIEEYEKDGNLEFFLLSLKNIAKAQGGMSKLAKNTSLTRQSLYKALSKKGNPRLDTLSAVLNGLGFRLSVESIS